MAAKPLISLGIRQKVHSENEIRTWEDLWLPTIPTRPSRPIAPVVHPMFHVSELIIGSPRRWNTELLEKYINPEDIPLIQSLAIIQGYHRDVYCWSYTKNVMYIVKSEYWVAMNLLNRDTMETHAEPSITKLQAFDWKIQAPPKKNIIFGKQYIYIQLAMTSNLIHRHMRCDNHCPRCGAEDEIINHAILNVPKLYTHGHMQQPQL